MDSNSRSKLEVLRDQVRARQAKLGGYFQNTEDGRALMTALEENFFNGDLMAATPEQTAFNLGAREVVRFIRQLRDAAKPQE